MVVREIKPGILEVGALDFDRRLFDALIPLPNGTSYNAYLIHGSEKTALIDTVDPSREFDLICNLVSAGTDTIDYIVANHAEQDHSGTIPMILELFPGAKVVTNEKCRDILIDLLELADDRFIVIKDRETLSLGDRTLEFILAPWVHWPETMLTYLREDRILFTCDLFGSHYASGDLYADDERAIYPAAKRYYAEIMMPFRVSIRGHLEKIQPLDIDIIAPSHGPVHRSPSMILDAYRDWTSENVKNEVIIPYVSMHGSTKKMVEYLTGALIGRGITVRPFEIAHTDLGELAMGLVDAATVVVGTPTVLFGPHPAILTPVYLVNVLKPKIRFASVIGSFGWGGKTVDTIAGMLTHVKPEIIPPVYVKGAPTAETLRSLDRLADDIVERHKKLNLL
jgi:flavorubredoxin